MQHLLLLAALAAPTALANSTPTAAAPSLALERTQDDKGPSKEEVKETLEALAEGLRSKEPSLRIQALEAASKVAHPKVVDAIAKAVSDKSPEVRDFALDRLGQSQLDEALEHLTKYHKKKRRDLEKDPEQYALVIKAIARHASAETIPAIVDRCWEVKSHDLVRTRIYALANIREPEAVEALMELLVRADRRKISPHIEEFRLALTILLAVDVGASQDRWVEWWNDNKKSFEVARAFPKLPQDRLNIWRGFWGLERTYQRPKRRGDRGGDDG